MAEPTPTSFSYLKRIFVPHPDLKPKVPIGLLTTTMRKNRQNADAKNQETDSSKGYDPHLRRNLSSRFRSIILDAILGRKESPSMHKGRSGSPEDDEGLGQLTRTKESDRAEVTVGSGRTSSEYSNCEDQTITDEIASSLSVTLSLGESVGEQNGGKCDKADRNHEDTFEALPSLECKASSGIDETNLSCGGIPGTGSRNAKYISMSRRTRRASSLQTQGSKCADVDEVNQQNQKQCENRLEDGNNWENISHNHRSIKRRNREREHDRKNGRRGAGEELCKKRILIGQRCKPLTPSRSLNYDEEGVLIPEVIP